MLNKRCLSLIECLIKTEHPVQINNLAERFSVSVRTIQYDLKRIDRWLNKYDFPILKRRRGVGVTIPKDERIKEILYRTDIPDSPGDYNYSPLERKCILLDRLLDAGDQDIPISHIADELRVSEATIYLDIGEAREYAARYGLHLLSKPNVGTRIEGEEIAIRRLYADMLWNILIQFRSEQQEYEAIKLIDEWTRMQVSLRVLQDVKIQTIIDAVLQFEYLNQVALTDLSFAQLSINIAVLVHRNLHGFRINIPREEQDYLQIGRGYALAESIATELSAQYDFDLAISELAQIASFLLGAKIQGFCDDKILRTDDPVHLDSASAARVIIEKIERRLCLNLQEQDPNLLRDIALQLDSFLCRQKFNLPIERFPLLGKLKSIYPRIYDATRAVTLSVLGCDTPEDEVGFIAMHVIGAATSKGLYDRQQTRIRVLIVCGTGLGSAKLLSSRLLSEFNGVEIVAIEPYHNLKKYLAGDTYDILLSTIPLENEKLEYIKVSPFLTKEDVHNLRNHLKACLNKFNPRSSLAHILDLVADRTGMDDSHRLQVEIQVLKDFLSEDLETPQGIKMLGFLDLLPVEAIQLHKRAREWKDAIRQAGRPLVASGAISERYVDAMIENKEHLGEYIVIAKGVAFPHASPEDDVHSTCFSLLTLKKPVVFGHPRHDPVDIIIAMACSNSWNHTEALSQLLRILNNKRALCRIRAARDSTAVINVCREIVG